MKASFLYGLLFASFLGIVSPVKASLLQLSQGGELEWSVLGYTNESPEELTIIKAPKKISGEAYVALEREGESTYLTVISEGYKQKSDITVLKDEIITLEAKQKSQEIQIINSENGFRIIQDEVAAETQFPIYIDTKDSKLSVDTDVGRQYILIMPAEAFELVSRANIFSKLNDGSVIALIQGRQGEVLYQLNGQKIVSLFNLMEVPVDVTATVSASTGKIKEVNKPAWLQVLSFLFQEKIS